MRVDTTVVETNIHYPTDSSLFGDGARVLTRVMKKITKKITGIVGEVGAKLRDRSRSVKIPGPLDARAARSQGPQSGTKLEKAYGKVLMSTAAWWDGRSASRVKLPMVRSAPRALKSSVLALR